MAAGAVVLGEPAAVHHVLGALLIIIGVAGTNLLDRDGASKQELGAP